MFVLNSDITIGNFRFSGVHNIKIRRSLHSIADIAVISLPSVAKIVSTAKMNPEQVITGNQFKDGDPVTINLGYNSELKTEFRGFVRRRSLNMPLEVECEGYSWLLRRNKVKKFWQTATVKELLEAAVAGIDANYNITIRCETDLSLTNFSANGTGFDLINSLLKSTDGCLSCFFIQPDVLWCGLVYSAYAKGDDSFDEGKVGYKLGYNTIKGNTLKERSAENDPVQIVYNKRQADGNHLSGISSVFNDTVRTQSRILNHIDDQQVLNNLANEKAYQLNYAGYEGDITTFLQPYAQPGWIASLSDDRYPERNGDYLVEATEVTFGVKGARRIVEPGPLVGFSKK